MMISDYNRAKMHQLLDVCMDRAEKNEDIMMIFKGDIDGPITSVFAKDGYNDLRYTLCFPAPNSVLRFVDEKPFGIAFKEDV